MIPYSETVFIHMLIGWDCHCHFRTCTPGSIYSVSANKLYMHSDYTHGQVCYIKGPTATVGSLVISRTCLLYTGKLADLAVG